jgi:PAS domain S-box-containing protein
MWQRFSRSTPGRYSISLVATAVALLLRRLLDPILGDYSPFITLYPTIVFLAMYVGVGPSVASAIIGVLGVTYWFLQHRNLFHLSTPAHIAGSLIFLLVSASITAACEVGRRSQMRLRRAEEQLRRFLEAAPTGLTRCSRDLRYLSANWAYAEIAGLPVDQIVGRRIVDVIGSDAWEAIRPYVDRVLHGERVEYETRLPFVSAGSRQLHVVYTPEKNGEEVVGWVASISDITEFKRVEKQLQEMEKMAAAGQLAASLAHEINNPLSVVVNMLYLLRSRSDHDPTSTGWISIATEELARVSRIVSQSLSYYRVGIEAKEVDLAALIEESLKVFSDRFQRAGIAITKKIRPRTSILGFSDEIRQVVDNLLVNAVEATPRGGGLALCLRESRGWKNRSELGVRLTIADNGSGIPKASLSRVFEPFFTTKAEKGNGLGLWVVKGIVEKHGGSINIRSTDAAARSGTAISIFLPSTAKQAPRAARTIRKTPLKDR